jgi:hypothetical protein
MPRAIKNILYFRQDISPFLVHLTKTTEEGIGAKDALENIIRERKLVAGEVPMSDVRFGISNDDIKKQYCRAISFTETPLNEIHCLLEIAGRTCQLEAYGLVFMKDKLRKKGVSPVLYINNEEGDKMEVIRALCLLIKIEPESAKQILPLISSFGKRLVTEGNIDFLWEREWRYPSVKGDLQFNKNDVFVGLCPDGETSYFERLFPDVQFVDCQRNMKWYAKKIVDAKDRFPDFKHSVV